MALACFLETPAQLRDHLREKNYLKIIKVRYQGQTNRAHPGLEARVVTNLTGGTAVPSGDTAPRPAAPEVGNPEPPLCPLTVKCRPESSCRHSNPGSQGPGPGPGPSAPPARQDALPAATQSCRCPRGRLPHAQTLAPPTALIGPAATRLTTRTSPR